MKTDENTGMRNRACRWTVGQKTLGKTVLRGLLDDFSKETELIRAGIVPEELEYLCRDERKRILQAAGLDPEEYDF